VVMAVGFPFASAIRRSNSGSGIAASCCQSEDWSRVMPSFWRVGKESLDDDTLWPLSVLPLAALELGFGNRGELLPV